MVFKKGQSGNPLGLQNKDIYTFKRKCQQMSPRALQRLEQALESGNRLDWQFAVEMVLAYAFGKPKQQVEMSGETKQSISIQIIRHDGKPAIDITAGGDVQALAETDGRSDEPGD